MYVRVLECIAEGVYELVGLEIGPKSVPSVFFKAWDGVIAEFSRIFVRRDHIRAMSVYRRSDISLYNLVEFITYPSLVHSKSTVEVAMFNLKLRDWATPPLLKRKPKGTVNEMMIK